MKTLLVMALGAMFAMSPDNVAAPTPESFTIDADRVENGLRIIEATPSKLVCSKKITVTVNNETGIIEDVNYVGGCPGNLQAVRSLLKGLSVDQAIEKLDGILCGRRGTSCTDQLARILKKAYGK